MYNSLRAVRVLIPCRSNNTVIIQFVFFIFNELCHTFKKIGKLVLFYNDHFLNDMRNQCVLGFGFTTSEKIEKFGI